MDKDSKIEILELKLVIAKLEKRVQELECENKKLKCIEIYPYWRYDQYTYTYLSTDDQVTSRYDSCTR